MTYCIGWIQGDSAYLAADTAVTSDDPPVTKYSSVGELHERVRGMYVQESLLKIVVIGEGAVVAFAGDFALIKALAQFLVSVYSPQHEVHTLIRMAEITLGPFDSGHVASMLVARSFAGRRAPELYHWESQSQPLETGGSCYSIGSMATYKSYTQNVVRALTIMGATGRRALTTMIALIQSYGVRDLMFQQNIGGMIVGVMTAHGHVDWPRDTQVMIYDDDTADTIRAKAVYVGGGVGIGSSLAPVRVLFTTHELGWIGRQIPEIVRRIYDEQAEQWIFIHKKRWHITIADGDAGDYAAVKHASIRPDENGQPKVYLSELLLEAMRCVPPGKSPSSPYVCFMP